MADMSPLARLQSGTAPIALRMAVAEGMIPLDGGDLIEAFKILATDPDQEVRNALRENLPTLPRALISQISRDNSSPPHMLHLLSEVFTSDDEILSGIILNKSVSDETLISTAESAPPSILVLLGENKARMIRCPQILEVLLNNSQLPKATRFSLIEFKEKWADLPEFAWTSPKSGSEPKEESQKSAAETVKAVSLDLDDTDLSLLEEAKSSSETVTGVKPETLVPEMPVATDAQAVVLDEPVERVAPKTSSKPKIAQGKKAEEGKARLDVGDGWDLDDFAEDDSLEDEGTEQGFDEENLELEEDDETSSSGNVEGWEDVEFDEDGVDIDDDETESGTFDDEKIEDTRMRMLRLGSSDKILLAKMGTKQERAVLLRDSNKKVAVAVVQSPKLSDFEAKMIAANRSVCEEVLTEIYIHREFGRDPAIQRELALNPKTPLQLATRLLSKLNDFDLKEVSKSKEVPYGLVQAAKRVLDMREARRSRRKGG